MHSRLLDAIEQEIEGKLPKISAVMWDLDATIIDSEKFYINSIRNHLNKYNVVHDMDLLIGRDLRYVWSLLESAQTDYLDYQTWEAAVINNVLTSISPGDEITGVRNTLQWLQEQGIQQSLVTNSPRRFAHEAIDMLDIKDFFHHVITRNDVRFGKPDPEPYALSIKLHGVLPHEALAIEDSVAGSISALAAMANVAVLTTQARTLFSPQVIHFNNQQDLLTALNNQ